MSLTEKLKQELWQCFGTKEYPAEWDGIVYGGGKLSQRYWEYLITIEYLDLDENSVLLEIGGGSPITGYGFFSSILKKHIKKIIILDPNVLPEHKSDDKIEFVKMNASYDNLKKLLNRGEITHISCISVFEHIDDKVRNDMVQGINDHFSGVNFVTTFEYHPTQVHFETQLTAQTISEMFSHFTKMYPTDFSSSPVLCENAFTIKHRLAIRGLKTRFKKVYIPTWYPVATKFVPFQ